MKTLWTTLAVTCAAGFGAGCGGSEHPEISRRELPFVVKLNPVRVLGAGGSQEATPSPGFGNAADLTRQMAEELRKAGTFTWVSLEEDTNITPDLELQVDFIEPDFGEGQVQWTGAFLSTLTWLLAGHLSWMIDNRNYPDARVVMRMDLRPTASDADTTTKEDWYHDDLPLKGLSTNFFERADARFWALNILVPPWWGDGDAETAGESLIDRALEYFVENEPDRMFLALPGAYYRNRYSFLVNDAERDEVLIITRQNIEELRIRCDSGKKRVLGDAQLAEFEVVRDSDREEIRRILAGKVIGLGDLEGDFIYRVRLDDDERGYVRITAQLRGLSIPKGQWTVYRPRPRSP